MRVVDVSQWQGDIDWSKVSGEVEAAIVRVADGDVRDAAYTPARVQSIRKSKLTFGPYYYARVASQGNGQRNGAQEAEMAIGFAKSAGWGRPGDLPLAYDFEESNGQPNDKAARHLVEFIEAYKQITGHYPIVYTMPGFWTYIERSLSPIDNGLVKKCPLWIASWGVQNAPVPSPWKDFVLWQYTDHASCAGIKGAVDMSVTKDNDTLKKLSIDRVHHQGGGHHGKPDEPDEPDDHEGGGIKPGGKRGDHKDAAKRWAKKAQKAAGKDRDLTGHALAHVLHNIQAAKAFRGKDAALVAANRARKAFVDGKPNVVKHQMEVVIKTLKAKSPPDGAPSDLPKKYWKLWEKPWTRRAARSGGFKDWLWLHGFVSPHFTRAEWACSDGTPVPEGLRGNAQRHGFNLEKFRHELGDIPLDPISLYRTPSRNVAVGGATASRHVQADASDFSVGTISSVGHGKWYAAAEKVFANGGVGSYPSGSGHLDSRGYRARW